MTMILTDNANYSNIANAIRSKAGVQDLFKPSEMAGAILAIPSGGGSAVLGSKNITANGTYYAQADSLDGYSEVTVSVSGGGSGDLTGFIDGTVSNVECDATYVRSYAFYSCSLLQNVSLPLCSYVSANAFSGCSLLQNVSLPLCERILGSAFQYCYSLQEIFIPSCQLISSSAFAACSSLQYVSAPSCEVIESNAFRNCSNISFIYAPSCISINDYAFLNCTRLESVNLPNCTIIRSSAFCSCSVISFVSLPKCVSIKQSAFQSCRSMHTAWLPALSYISYAVFDECNKLMSLYLLSTSYVSVYNINANFGTTPMSKSSYTGSFGSIFVRASLYDTFISASGWSTYSERLVSLTDAEVEALPFW